MAITATQKKWAWGIGSVLAIGTVAFFTKDKWMPLFKKQTADAPTGKPPVVTSSTPTVKEEVKSGFVPSDLNYPKKTELAYPKSQAKSNFNYPYRSNLDNRPSFDGGRFTMIDITNKKEGAGFDFTKVKKGGFDFTGSSQLDNNPF